MKSPMAWTRTYASCCSGSSLAGRDERSCTTVSIRSIGAKTTTNNYGFAPAEGQGPECFQMQLYAELQKLLEGSLELSRSTRVLEISCGRGGGLGQLARGLPAGAQVVGLDFSANAIAFCRRRYAARPTCRTSAAMRLQLPFKDESFDVVVSVEASHAYGNDRGVPARGQAGAAPAGPVSLRRLPHPPKGAEAGAARARCRPRRTSCATSPRTWSAPASATRNAAAGSSNPICPGTTAGWSAPGSSAMRGFRGRQPSSAFAAVTGCTSSPA